MCLALRVGLAGSTARLTRDYPPQREFFEKCHERPHVDGTVALLCFADVDGVTCGQYFLFV